MTVGATRLMMRQETLKPDYHHSEAHAFWANHPENDGSCMPPALEVPSEQMAILAKNALESLNPTDYASFEANEEYGKAVFMERLKASQARLANSYWRTPRPGSRTDRTETLRSTRHREASR